ncbi:hypothetical protein O3P69_011570 [Scylla paramamosain]|uniref:Single domain-containing protein n=1 Tax=Scylla paramamosain TaxID=85552 RepID=A0AAW0T871_SCYPA
MRAFLLLLAWTMLLSATNAKVYYPNRVCYADGKTVSHGETWTTSDCRLGKCTNGYITYQECDAQPPNDPLCGFSQDLALPYPGCCPIIYCI